MTKNEILELAKTCGFDYFTGTIEEDSSPYWECWEDQLLRFAQIIHKNGYCDGSVEGYEEGRYDGYESAKVSTEMNTMEFDDD